MNRTQEISSVNFEKNLGKRYSEIEKGYCMLADAARNLRKASRCDERVGRRHSISRLHLKLITDVDHHPDHVLATKENRSFFEHKDHGEQLRLTSIREFSAGRWGCQVHDEMFSPLDEQLIDLSIPENLFKIVCRVVFHHSLLIQLRWIPIWESIQSDSGWEQFKKNALIQPVGDEEAYDELRKWYDAAIAINTLAEKLSRNLLESNWNYLRVRACMLKSEPVVAGWGCFGMKFDLSGLNDKDLRKDGWKHLLSPGYIIVIPQEYGHGIITACESSEQFRVEEITRIHRIIPYDVGIGEPYIASEKMKRLMSNSVWSLNELGIKPSLYENWNNKERTKVNEWLRLGNREKKLVWADGFEPSHLPSLF